jgi:hypothetical protein
VKEEETKTNDQMTKLKEEKQMKIEIVKKALIEVLAENRNGISLA